MKIPAYVSFLTIALNVIVPALVWYGFFRMAQSAALQPGERRRLVTAVPPLIGIGYLILSPAFRKVLQAVPYHQIVGIQVVRSIGVLFLILSGLGLMPTTFAGPAGWGDTLTGIVAPMVAYALATQKRWSRPLAFGWNLFGMVDLVTAVTLGVLTAPGILQRLALDQPNVLITTFPIVLIPSLAVPLMMLLHIFSLYQLQTQQQQGIAETAVVSAVFGRRLVY
ncbi:MAG: hypothetical protein ACE5FD_01470 [Anaerolineae bacterium]